MDVINYSASRNLLTVARGHPYERDAFRALFEGLDEYDINHVEQPVAQQLMNAQAAQNFDAIVCYDMPGVDFTSADAPASVAPPEAFKQNYLAMLEAGVGMVMMHHSIAAWPAWPEYAEIVGGRFHYRFAQLRGTDWPDSGYRHQVEHTLNKVADHPVTAGLPESFTMTDELYLCPLFEADVIPLLRSSYAFTQDNFYSSARAVAGEMFSQEGWSHPDSTNLVGWVKHYGNSPIVYLQGGDDSTAMGNEHFRQLVHNAVRWVSSDQARDWARSRA